MEFGERLWMVNDEWINAECKRKSKVKGNGMWTQDERFI